MPRLEDLTTGTLVKGIVPEPSTEFLSAQWHGSDVLEVVCRDNAGRVGTEILFRDREALLEIVTAGRPWSFDGEGRLLRLVSEAHCVLLAHLLDPLLEVEATEEQIIDQATATRTIAELEKEIGILSSLEKLALEVRRSGKGRTWDEFSALLQTGAGRGRQSQALPPYRAWHSRLRQTRAPAT